MNGYTFDLSERQQTENEIKSIIGFLNVQPYNTFWQNRLTNAQMKLVAIAQREDERFAAEMEQASRDNFVATGLDRDGDETGISQPVIF